MSEDVKPIPKDLLNFERMAFRIKIAAAVIYARDNALENGGTEEQFAARMKLTVRQFRKMILDILKTDVDDTADMFTALGARLRVRSIPIWPEPQALPTAEGNTPPSPSTSPSEQHKLKRKGA